MTTKTLPDNARRFCTAPMMDWSDSHCRLFWRTLSKDAFLYTEMVTTGALIHGDGGPDRFIRYRDEEHPVALQLGGSNPKDLAQCAKIAQDFGYDEVNLNVGCPSDRVQNNMIGACLMGHPQLVADCIKAMQDAVEIPVTVKHRIGIDDQDSYEHLHHFVDTVAATGCETFIIHGRKAILDGLSPKENREIPPLRYEVVQQIKQDLPQLEVILNGGIKTHKEATEHLKWADGVMLGREAYHNPSVLMDVDALYYGHEPQTKDKKDCIRALYPHIEDHLSKGFKLSYVTRHILGLFNGQPGSRLFRRHLSEQAFKKDASIQTIEDALAYMPD
ncbi:tRNA dihydrouridine(20/20a) synthase DusA [Bermanella marisrubri]|uniref:tRNA-dihydrouridine(20/20a) synthase n=1 Tax=Bermanella marisrubri TaxID=207949 RepID=Q1N4I3_9GAMM|nr:tRNA dihydrouridine(20/20a) synthase DusA [Bermanella marisrubri]EAT13445.1 Dihydrouridine synthase TIM-barrel protein yjbN [Oceanobacter sp. RED65] [Bermanella marisrubri]QIZ84192.1 tRNA dihydrouridine(20/20a) synthase DusA [Bermanella marisrubri]